jgi:hypothetical protein
VIRDDHERVLSTGHKGESRKDFPSGHMEKAETGAVGRALAFLGYGTQFGELDEGRLSDSPQPTQTAAAPRNGGTVGQVRAAGTVATALCSFCHSKAGEVHKGGCKAIIPDPAAQPATPPQAATPAPLPQPAPVQATAAQPAQAQTATTAATVPDEWDVAWKTLRTLPNFPKDKEHRTALLAVLCEVKPEQVGKETLPASAFVQAIARFQKRNEARATWDELVRNNYQNPGEETTMHLLGGVGIRGRAGSWEIKPAEWRGAAAALQGLIEKAQEEAAVRSSAQPVAAPAPPVAPATRPSLRLEQGGDPFVDPDEAAPALSLPAAMADPDDALFDEKDD